MCLSATVVNSVGLMLDIIGVIFLFLFGLPPKVSNPDQGNILNWAFGPPGKEKELRYKIHWWFSHAGLGLLVLGFLLQIWSNWM